MDPPPEKQRPARHSAPARRFLWRVVRSRLFLTGALSTLCFGACSDSKEPETAEETPTTAVGPDQPASHLRMVKLLAQLSELTAPENPYVGDHQAILWRKRLAAVPKQPSAQRLQALVSLAEAEALQGKEQEVLKGLREAYQIYFKLTPRLPLTALNDLRYRLGVASLRYGETRNCCARFNAESCIIPIQGRGIHTDPEGSNNAIRYFTEILESGNVSTQMRLRSQWLLNLAYMTIDGYPDRVPPTHRIPPKVFNSGEPGPKFVNIAPKLDLETFNLAGGVIIDDFDGDHLLDIVSSTFDSDGQMRFFRNEGDGSFSEQSKQAGLTGLTGGLNLEQADYNNDGHLDVLVLRGAWLQKAGRHPNSLLRNNGDGTFTDITFPAGLANESYPTQTAAWSDYDLDGDLDLYVGNEQIGGLKAPNQLFRNNGDGTFTDVAPQAGVLNQRFTKGVSWGDYDNDRFPDLYVANLMGPNRLYRNKGDGTFVDLAPELKVTRPMAAFPTWFWDYDNDGILDIYVAANRGQPESLSSLVESSLGFPCDDELACLYRGNGQGGFVESAAELGLTRLSLPMGCNFGDLDNDGYLDFYLGTGYPAYDALMPNVMYHNRAGERFADITWSSGLGHLQKGHGVAFADLDHDGDQDLYVQTGGGATGDKFNDALFENPGSNNNWIALKLVGTRTNRCAIGARIRLLVTEEGSSEPRAIYRHVNSGGSFGANPLRQTLGTGKAKVIDRLEIYWPTSDTTQHFENVATNQMLQITESSDKFEVVPLVSFRFPEK